MKKLLTVLVAMSFIYTASAQTSNIKVGPLGFLVGYYNASYEKVVSDKGTVQVGANFYNYEVFDNKTTGFGLGAGYRLYFKEAMRGAYLYPAANFRLNSTEILSEKRNFSLLGIGATIGYQWVAGGGFVTDLGVGYGFNLELSKDEALSNDYGGGSPRIQFAIGYAF